ncbi:MAG: hypothetical protein CME66_01320 [Halobacteriovoraceae bacterium]|nr:hypothetical protein [Halobacteriovoraceae bacterium]
MAKLFVALNFSSDGLLSRKITGFRRRFDPKYNQYSFAHMSLLAPFEVFDSDIAELGETLKEEIETFYYDNKTAPKLAFTGVGVHEYKRKQHLYLNPCYNIDLSHCSDMIVDICKSFIPRSVKYKENKSQFLPLGVFNNEDDLHTVLEHAKLEFNHNSELTIKSISLYQRRMGIWVENEVLVKFPDSEKHFLHLNNHSL